MPQAGEIYRHYKTYSDGTHDYEVIYIALHTETGENLVIYRPAHDTIDHTIYDVFARPLSMRNEDVEYNGKIVKRFIKIS